MQSSNGTILESYTQTQMFVLPENTHEYAYIVTIITLYIYRYVYVPYTLEHLYLLELVATARKYL